MLWLVQFLDRFFRKPMAKGVKEQVTNIFQKLVTYFSLGGITCVWI